VVYGALLLWAVAVLVLGAVQARWDEGGAAFLAVALLAASAACSSFRVHVTDSSFGPLLTVAGAVLAPVAATDRPFAAVALYVLGAALSQAISTLSVAVTVIAAAQAAGVGGVTMAVLGALTEAGWNIFPAVLAAEAAGVLLLLLVGAFRARWNAHGAARPFGRVRWLRLGAIVLASAAVGSALALLADGGVPGVLAPGTASTAGIVLLVFALVVYAVYLMSVVSETREQIDLMLDASRALARADRVQVDAILVAYACAMLGTDSVRLQPRPPGPFETGIPLPGRRPVEYLVVDRWHRGNQGSQRRDRQLVAGLAALTAPPSVRPQTVDRPVAVPLVPREVTEARTRAVVRALEDGALRAAFQPIVDVARGTIIGTEAVVRSDAPELAALGAQELVSIARVAGRLDRLTELVLESAVRGAARFAELAPGLTRLHVNVEPEHLVNRLVRDALDRLRAQHPRLVLCLELSERSEPDALLGFADVVTQLRAQGIQFAYDDFGSLDSNVLSIAALDFDVVKIDQTFAANLHRPGYRRILKAITGAAVSYARRMLVLEGVETAEIERAGRRLGLRYMQGYLYGEPVTADALADRLRARGARL